VLVHFIHTHIHVRPHTYTSAFSHEGTYTFVRAHPRENAHAHEYDAYGRARADTHAPWPRWPDHARTHAPAHEHAFMRTHTRKHTRTCKHAHAHPRYAHARNHMQACSRTTCMYAYACGICTHVPAQCSYMRTYAHALTRLHIRPHSCKHTPTYFGCVLTDWGHTPHE